MGKKYIITESQEKILSRLIERVLGPEESVFVANKNPFKEEEYRGARQLYSEYLSTGDLYYILDTEGACKFINNKNLETVKKVIPSIEGKTIRYDDKIYTIGKTNTNIGMGSDANIIVQVELKDSSSGVFRTFSGFLSTKYRGDTEPSFDILGVRIEKEFVIIPLRKAYGSDISVLSNNFCSSGYPQTIGLENVPDEFFEIRKIERIKTDL